MEDLRIDGMGAVLGAGLIGEIQVYGSPYQAVCQALSHLQLLLLGKEAAFDIDIGTLGVERTYFEGELPAFELGIGLAIAGHGLNHSLKNISAKLLKILVIF